MVAREATRAAKVVWVAVRVLVEVRVLGAEVRAVVAVTVLERAVEAVARAEAWAAILAQERAAGGAVARAAGGSAVAGWVAGLVAGCCRRSRKHPPVSRIPRGKRPGCSPAGRLSSRCCGGRAREREERERERERRGERETTTTAERLLREEQPRPCAVAGERRAGSGSTAREGAERRTNCSCEK